MCKSKKKILLPLEPIPEEKRNKSRKPAMLKEETAVKVLSVVAICNKIIAPHMLGRSNIL